ncbi:citrate lyase, beta subunit [Oceanicola granulosus HTCC2516]|uniref:Citrate lyase, beta subunit n=1 Tax=Oceanicola granulosus (strain ATCC BAA-861 / DSM 15982 / KCTC 12143 / HTCC2516) TaxID=314256 RepID=Q2CI36_OCEGH|nr:CoA ester lyase [Oceanicola granulosus]EAR52422.1 citrate lyase, beta subunit [Oceanicola granulosus HTCC2516]
MTPLCRSVLYVPAANARAMAKAGTLPCDGIIYDLEDAVAPGHKGAARDALAAGIVAGAGKLRLVRINALATEWGRADAAAVAGLEVAGVLLPKVASGGDVEAAAALLPGRALWAMIETPAGVLAAAEIAAHPAVAGLVMGTNDLAHDLGAAPGAGRAELAVALQTGLLAARAAGILALDGVFTALDDAEGLAAECAEGRRLGFDGKTVIHPGQIAAANAAFAPTEAECDLARRQIAAHEAALARGQGVAVVDGRIVENLHVAAARDRLRRAEAIRAREGMER